jgi:YbbR domain-containing protein
LVDQVDAAVVEVALPGVRSTVERQQPVSLRNSAGEALTGIEDVSPRTVEVAVEIARRPGYRDFSVRVPYTGAPARGYQIASIAVDPSLVTLRGSPEAFDRLPGYVETLPIDLEGATEDIRARLALNLPEPLSVIGLQNIAVQIEISPIMGSRDLRLEPVVRGLDLGLTRTVPIETADLVVSGPLPVLDTLDGGSIQVILDLSGLEAGVHSVPLQAVVPEGVTVVSLLPAAVEITLSPLPSPTVTTPIPELDSSSDRP